jgi:transcriptional regulator with GAF, ATPase, and Fis domain
MLRDASPCGVTVDRNTTQLLYRPEQIFPMRAKPRIYEALLIPFHLDQKPIGTVWVVTHDSARQFDREDERILAALAKFASVGWMLHKTHIEAEQLARKHWDQLIATNEMLQTVSNSLSHTLMKADK